MSERPDIAARPDVLAAVDTALREDLGRGDATSEALVPAAARASGRVIARQRCTVAGVPVAALVFREADARLAVRAVVAEGAEAEPGAVLLEVEGSARALLAAERTALNFLQRMCGVATLTRRFVERARPYGVAILDTRKTTPGLRALEKYAVLCGGGVNHRTDLGERILIKDNHRRLWAAGGGRLSAAVLAARKRFPDRLVEIEVESLEELNDALEGRPDWVLLDNMPPALMAEAARLCRGRARTEASGGIGEENLDEVLRTGVDAISLGRLTHSAPAADLSLEMDE